jgi:hypothetical protein
VGLERSPLRLVSTIEGLLGRKNSGSGLEIENTAVGIRHDDQATPLNPQKLVLTSPASGGGSVFILHSQTQATEFSLGLTCPVLVGFSVRAPQLHSVTSTVYGPLTLQSIEQLVCRLPLDALSALR